MLHDHAPHQPPPAPKARRPEGPKARRVSPHPPIYSPGRVFFRQPRYSTPIVPPVA
nr:MAG TPA: hypothetical protein [Caudoviricetes sp.]